MEYSFVASLLYFYGIFLIACGITAVIFIGFKAKTALASGGMSGTLAIVTGYFVSTGSGAARIAGIVLALALLIVFSWRSTKTLFKIFELLSVSAPQEELNGKGIAFLIISLMAITSVFVIALQLTA